MSNYETTLEEARSASNKGAKFYIPLLYDILVNEENKTAEDARKIIEHDLIEYWSKATVRKFLPQETKDEDKIKAAKASHENRKPIVITTDGSQESAGINPAASNPVQPTEQDSGSSGSKEQEQEEPTAEELAEISKSLETPTEPEEIKQLFKTLSQRHDGIKHFFYDTYGTNLLNSRIIKNLENSGVKVFKRLYFEV